MSIAHQTDKKTGIIYYSLPKGTVLYRGDSDPKIGNKMTLENQITFFGFDQGNVEENYGVAYKFRTTNELKLIALDKIGLDNDIKTKFLAIIDKKCKNQEEYEKIKRILDENYGYKNGIRTSVSKNDKTISQFICDNFTKYDGYACEEMQTDFGGKFHSEAMICKPKDNLVGGEIVTEESKIKGMREKHTERRQQPKKKTKSRFFDKDESSDDEHSKSRIFDNYESSEDESSSSDINLIKRRMSEDDDYDYDTPPKRLFGGRKHKTKSRRKTKKQKTNSRRKKNKQTRKQRFK